MTETNTAVAAIITSKTAIASTERAATTTEPLVDGATAIIYILLGAIILISVAQLSDADKHEHDTLFEEIVEKMLTAHLINTCGKLWREAQASTMGYAAIDNWNRKIEHAAEKTRSWRLAHG